MTSSIFPEALLTFQAAAAELPGRPNLSTLHRWRLRGCRGIKLQTVKIGGRRFVSREALAAFAAATTAAASGEAPPALTPRQRAHAVEMADRVLKADGI